MKQKTILKYSSIAPVNKKRGRHALGCKCGKCIQSGGSGGYRPAKKISMPAGPETSFVPPINNHSASDTDLFGDIKPPGERSADTQDGAQDGAQGEAQGEAQDGAQSAESTPEMQRPLASGVWDTIINFLAAMVGNFWLPRPIGKNAAAGEISYDEREMVVSSICVYLASIGMKVLSPFESMAMAIFAYASPRLRETFTWIKFRFMKKAKKAEPQASAPFATDTRTPQPPVEPAKPTEPAETLNHNPLDAINL